MQFLKNALLTTAALTTLLFSAPDFSRQEARQETAPYKSALRYLDPRNYFGPKEAEAGGRFRSGGDVFVSGGVIVRRHGTFVSGCFNCFPVGIVGVPVVTAPLVVRRAGTYIIEGDPVYAVGPPSQQVKPQEPQQPYPTPSLVELAREAGAGGVYKKLYEEGREKPVREERAEQPQLQEYQSTIARQQKQIERQQVEIAQYEKALGDQQSQLAAQGKKIDDLSTRLADMQKPGFLEKFAKALVPKEAIAAPKPETKVEFRARYSNKIDPIQFDDEAIRYMEVYAKAAGREDLVPYQIGRTRIVYRNRAGKVVAGVNLPDPQKVKINSSVDLINYINPELIKGGISPKVGIDIISAYAPSK